MSFVGDLVGDVLGGVTGSKQAAKGAERAADAQAGAMREGIQLQREIYEQTRSDQEPWRAAGIAGLTQLQQGLRPGGELNRLYSLADFQADPGYQFRMQQGEQAINRAAAAAGRYDSGRALKDLTEFNSGLASQEFGNAYNRWANDQTNRYNRLAGLAGVGQAANQQLQQSGQNFATQAGQGLAGIGDAQGAAHIARGNVTGNAVNSLLQIAGAAGGYFRTGK